MPNSAGIAKMVAASASLPHGNPGRYRSGCRCPECIAGQSQYSRDRHAAKKHGQRNAIISADEVRRHLVFLRDQGVATDTVAKLAGVLRRDVMQLRNGRQLNLREAKASRLLAVSPSAKDHNGEIPAVTARQQLQAIMEAGLTQREIGRRLGLKGRVHFPRERVRATKAARIQKLYEEVTPRRVCEVCYQEKMLPEFGLAAFRKDVTTCRDCVRRLIERQPIIYQQQAA